MTLLDIFSDKTRLDLALAVAALPEDSPERAELLRRAGLAKQAAMTFLSAISTLDAVRRGESDKCCGHVCSDENTLAEFVDGVLHDAELAAVERQLAQCKGCLEHALALAKITQEITPATPWREVVVGIARRGLRIISAPLEGFSELTLQPVAMLAPATEAPAARRWEVESHGITATFTLLLHEGGGVSLRMAFAREGTSIQKGQVGLRLNDALLEAHPLTNSHELEFIHLEPGTYTVELTLPDAEGAAFPLVLTSEQ